MSESEVCKLESVPLDFGDYHPLKPITVSFFVLLENESDFRFYICSFKIKRLVVVLMKLLSVLVF